MQWRLYRWKTNGGLVLIHIIIAVNRHSVDNLRVVGAISGMRKTICVNSKLPGDVLLTHLLNESNAVIIIGSDNDKLSYHHFRPCPYIAKPLSTSVMPYCQMDNWENIAAPILWKLNYFLPWISRLWKFDHMVSVSWSWRLETEPQCCHKTPNTYQWFVNYSYMWLYTREPKSHGFCDYLEVFAFVTILVYMCALPYVTIFNVTVCNHTFCISVVVIFGYLVCIPRRKTVMNCCHRPV